MSKGSLLGAREQRQLTPAEVIERVERHLLAAEAEAVVGGRSVGAIKEVLAPVCRAYYALAAASRRAGLHEEQRGEMRYMLFPVRSAVESLILSHLESSSDGLAIGMKGAFFGRSIKQGVSVRYPLMSCIPTKECGGRCYAHDGRDRDIDLIFRATLNYLVGRLFESGSQGVRNGVMSKLAKLIDRAVVDAEAEAREAAAGGFNREPRIRFSHVGEMADTPAFTNALAAEIKARQPNLQCVIYTRHPRVSELDSALLTVNVTLESSDDKRIRFSPQGARLVGSAWDGSLVDSVAVNFVEHHVADIKAATGSGHVCPVTTIGSNLTSCDEARCALCFESPAHTGPSQ